MHQLDQLSLVVPKALKQELRIVAAEQAMTMSRPARIALSEKLTAMATLRRKRRGQRKPKYA